MKRTINPAIRKLAAAVFFAQAAVMSKFSTTLQAVDCSAFMDICYLETSNYPDYTFSCDFGKTSCSDVTACIKVACGGKGPALCDPGDLQIGPNGYGTCSA